ncbi:MAG: hypothetical protein J7494_07900 [Sphingobium sp.]|nr:hypothetical protein [Sphingobium sp.]
MGKAILACGQRWLALVVISVMLGGCASIRASQKPVKVADIAATVCPSPTELEEFKRLSGGAAGKYRDDVIAKCLGAMDARYLEFKEDIRQEATNINLVGDTLAFGLTSGAAVVKGNVSKYLAAGGAFVAGTHSIINRDIFYQQTLPALISAMDARRDTVRAKLTRAQKDDPDAKGFKLADARASLNDYQMAGDLYAAISDITAEASKVAAEARKDRLDADKYTLPAVTVTKLDSAVSTRVTALTGKIRAMPDTDRVKLVDIARSLGLTPADDRQAALIRSDIVREIVAQVQGKDAATQTGNIDRLESTVEPLM